MDFEKEAAASAPCNCKRFGYREHWAGCAANYWPLIERLARRAYASAMEEAAVIAENPYSDEVCVIGEQSPLRVGAFIAVALRRKATEIAP